MQIERDREGCRGAGGEEEENLKEFSSFSSSISCNFHEGSDPLLLVIAGYCSSSSFTIIMVMALAFHSRGPAARTLLFLLRFLLSFFLLLLLLLLLLLRLFQFFFFSSFLIYYYSITAISSIYVIN